MFDDHCVNNEQSEIIFKTVVVTAVRNCATNWPEFPTACVVPLGEDDFFDTTSV